MKINDPLSFNIKNSNEYEYVKPHLLHLFPLGGHADRIHKYRHIDKMSTNQPYMITML